MSELRKATQADLDEIIAMYKATCDWAAAQKPNPVGWTFEYYPTPQVARDALGDGTLYVMSRGGKAVATVVLNHEQPPEYAGADWEVDAAPGRVMVVHTFMVHPDAAGQGVGMAMMREMERIARQQGMACLRLDTSEHNVPAQALYRKAGYRLCGMVDLNLDKPPYKWFHCYELNL